MGMTNYATENTIYSEDRATAVPLMNKAKSIAPCIVARAMMRFIGVVAILSAVGVWVVQTRMWDVEVVLVKLVVSVIFGTVGLSMLQVGRDLGEDEFHIDKARGELRHVKRGCDGIVRLQAAYRFEDLGNVRIEGGILEAQDRSGAALVRAEIRDVDAAAGLQVALQECAIGG